VHEGGGEAELSLHNLFVGGVDGCGLEGGFADEHHVHDNSEAPYINFEGVAGGALLRFDFEDFGGDVVGGAANSTALLGFVFELGGESEVSEFEIEFLVEEEVAEFDAEWWRGYSRWMRLLEWR
jgi:hypothetical protein